MHSKEEEEYVFFSLVDADISHAIRMLNILSCKLSKELQFCVLRDAVIAYCRPFNNNFGIFRKNLKINKSYVPSIYSELHRELLDLRNELFAHTDLVSRRPELHQWRKDRKIPITFIKFKGFDYNLFLLKKVKDMNLLFNCVLINVKKKQEELAKQLFKGDFLP